MFPYHGDDPEVPTEPLNWAYIIETDFDWVKLVSYKARVRKEKIVPTSAELKHGLQKFYIETRPLPDDLLFPQTSFKRSWNTLCKSCRISGVWMRDFRHYYNNQIRNRTDINDVERMLLLGQVQLSTNLRYSYLDEHFLDKYRTAVSPVVRGEGVS